MYQNPTLERLSRLYGSLIWLGSHLQSIYLFTMRWVWGHQFFLSGIENLKNIEKTSEYLATFHVPYPVFHAWEMGIVQAVGGILLFLGLASRLIAIPLFIVCVTLLMTVHATYLKEFSFITDPLILVIQKPYPLMMTSILMFVFGPGRLSIDAWIKRWVSKQPRY